jgi:Uma2 family endonuclease
MVAREKWISVDEFREIAQRPENADLHMELIEGVIYAMPPTGEVHGSSGARFLFFIYGYVDSKKLGRVTTAETGYIVHTDEDGKNTLLAPDVGFISKARMTPAPSLKYVPVAPDLAVEIMSPNDKAADIHLKINKYLQYGTRAVSVAYPESRTVVVHTLAGAQTLHEHETLDGGDILPGFALRVGEIFA